MYNEVEYKIALGRVVKYITSRGYSVNLRSTSFGVIEEEQLVTAPHNSSGVNLICSLLHEAGHIVQNKSNFTQLRNTIKRNKAIILEQEYTAWSEGYRIAEELRIDSPELYITYRQSWLTHWSSYINAVHAESESNAIAQWVQPYIET